MRTKRVRWFKDGRVKARGWSFSWRKQETLKIKDWVDVSIQKTNEANWCFEVTENAYWECKTAQFHWRRVHKTPWD